MQQGLKTRDIAVIALAICAGGLFGFIGLSGQQNVQQPPQQVQFDPYAPHNDKAKQAKKDEKKKDEKKKNEAVVEVSSGSGFGGGGGRGGGGGGGGGRGGGGKGEESRRADPNDPRVKALEAKVDDHCRVMFPNEPMYSRCKENHMKVQLGNIGLSK